MISAFRALASAKPQRPCGRAYNDTARTSVRQTVQRECARRMLGGGGPIYGSALGQPLYGSRASPLGILKRIILPPNGNGRKNLALRANSVLKSIA